MALPHVNNTQVLTGQDFADTLSTPLKMEQVWGLYEGHHSMGVALSSLSPRSRGQFLPTDHSCAARTSAENGKGLLGSPDALCGQAGVGRPQDTAEKLHGRLQVNQ